MSIEKLHREFLRSAGICTDSRKMIKGSLFFALKGEHFDGNAYVKDALASGCRMAVTENKALRGQPGIWYDPFPLEVMQDLARFHRRHINPEVIAITGSNGKTTTKELLTVILSKRYRVLATQGNLNNHIGVPLTLLSLKDEELAVIEMGANHPGEIRHLAEIAEPGTGIITNVGKAHLEGFGSLEGVLEAKGELYEYLAGHGGKAIVDSGESLLLKKAEQTGVETLVTGPGGDLPVSLRVMDQAPFLSIDLGIAGSGHRVDTRLVGAYNLQNIRLAAAAAYRLGVPPQDIASAVASYQPVNQRSQIVEGKGNRITLDSYNANPTSMREAINGLLEYSSGPCMVILGDMAELGDAAAGEHRQLARWVGTLGIDRVILVGPIFYRNCEPSSRQLVFSSRSELEAYLQAEQPGGYQILVKGSRVMELEKLRSTLVGSP
jgi:UDP-N-acetylmuramoyl-tripeptide--D-alanyl-D-alanine ligase